MHGVTKTMTPIKQKKEKGIIEVLLRETTKVNMNHHCPRSAKRSAGKGRPWVENQSDISSTTIWYPPSSASWRSTVVTKVELQPVFITAWGDEVFSKISCFIA